MGLAPVGAGWLEVEIVEGVRLFVQAEPRTFMSPPAVLFLPDPDHSVVGVACVSDFLITLLGDVTKETAGVLLEVSDVVLSVHFPDFDSLVADHLHDLIRVDISVHVVASVFVVDEIL